MLSTCRSQTLNQIRKEKEQISTMILYVNQFFLKNSFEISLQLPPQSHTHARNMKYEPFKSPFFNGGKYKISVFFFQSKSSIIPAGR